MLCDSPVVMNWDCERQGCFNLKKRLKFGVFKDSLPGKVSFTDVDGLVELNGNFLYMEWKGHRELSKGQQILFEQLTRHCPAVALVVEGDAETMTVDSVATARDGKIHKARTTNLDGLCAMITEWAQWARNNPVLLPQAMEAVCL